MMTDSELCRKKTRLARFWKRAGRGPDARGAGGTVLSDPGARGAAGWGSPDAAAEFSVAMVQSYRTQLPRRREYDSANSGSSRGVLPYSVARDPTEIFDNPRRVRAAFLAARNIRVRQMST
jgi:hypothetical protein